MPNTNKHIIDIISDIVATLRDVLTITSIVDNANNTYTFTVSDLKDLSAGDYVKIINTTGFNEDNQLIDSINSVNKTFTITKTSGTAIPTIKGTATLNKPYFDFGYWLEQANTLTLKGQSTTYRNQKYPLIFLQLEISETKNISEELNSINNMTIYFIKDTREDKSSSWRLDNVFKTVLIPLYEEFLLALCKSNFTTLNRSSKVEHNYIEKHLLGISDGNQNKVNQWIDAIEIQISFNYHIYGDCN
jgi:hypothetical protein